MNAPALLLCLAVLPGSLCAQDAREIFSQTPAIVVSPDARRLLPDELALRSERASAAQPETSPFTTTARSFTWENPIGEREAQRLPGDSQLQVAGILVPTVAPEETSTWSERVFGLNISRPATAFPAPPKLQDYFKWQGSSVSWNVLAQRPEPAPGLLLLSVRF